MTDSTCLIIVPMLGRSHFVTPLLSSLVGTEGCRILFVCSPGDDETIEVCQRSGVDTMIHDRRQGPGDYASKINKAYRESVEPLLFLGAGDLRFHPGWLDAARKKLVGQIGVVGTQDLAPTQRARQGQHATHSLVTRRYANLGTIDGPGILHEGYTHNYCDNELVETAKRRRAWAFAQRSIVEHLHPVWGKAPTDDVYALGRTDFDIDRAKFLERRRLWR